MTYYLCYTSHVLLGIYAAENRSHPLHCFFCGAPSVGSLHPLLLHGGQRAHGRAPHGTATTMGEGTMRRFRRNLPWILRARAARRANRRSRRSLFVVWDRVAPRVRRGSR